MRHTLVATSQPLTLGKRVPQVLDTENNEYRKCFSLSAHTAYAHTSYLQCFLPFAFHSQRPVRFSAARPFLSALELPKRKRATLEPAAAARQDAGHVGFIHLGHTRLCKVFGGAAHYGSVTAYQKPFFNVVYDDGHNEVMTGNQLAPLLRVDDAAFADPRRWAFDWTIMTMLKVQGFLPQIASYVRSFGLSLPAQWLDLMPDDVDTSTPSMDTAAAFLQTETLLLTNEHRRSFTDARAHRTLANYKNAALKLVWFALTHGWSLPPTAYEFGLYLTKLSLIRDNAGALEQARNALKLICSLNSVDGSIYNALRVLAPLEKARREYRHVAKKSAALTAAMVEAINNVYSYERTRRPPDEQWEFALGAAISAAFKLLARHNDAEKLRWDPGFCDVLDTHVRFYLHGRKNLQHGSALLDVARPGDNNPNGIYFLLARAKAFFRTGHVLPHIDRKTGVVDRTRPMPYYDYVAFLRSALVAIGLSEEQAALFAGHSTRAGGATAAAANGLHQEDIQHLAGVVSSTWLACYNRRYLDERLRVSRSLGL